MKNKKCQIFGLPPWVIIVIILVIFIYLVKTGVIKINP